MIIEECKRLIIWVRPKQLQTSIDQFGSFYVSRCAPGIKDLEVCMHTPKCFGFSELSDAASVRAIVTNLVHTSKEEFSVISQKLPPLQRYIALGLALTTGSALEELPPSLDECLRAFLVPNKTGLTAGARALSKHAHRGQENWWGICKGPVSSVNATALERYEHIMSFATWRNLHWLPHKILVYEVRVEEGYGMRWAQNRNTDKIMDDGNKEADADEAQENDEVVTDDNDDSEQARPPWIFRGFVEPMMEDGHERRWRH